MRLRYRILSFALFMLHVLALLLSQPYDSKYNLILTVSCCLISSLGISFWMKGDSLMAKWKRSIPHSMLVVSASYFSGYFLYVLMPFDSEYTTLALMPYKLTRLFLLP